MQVEMSDVRIWTETLVIVTAIVVVAAITWSGTRRRETFKDDGALFFTIVHAYKTTLDRPPSEAEIQMQKSRMLRDPEFDIAKLEMALRQSGEYRRLVALQRNTVHADLEGTMTDRQVHQKVVQMYMTAAGSDPDDATTAFLLERYRKSRLDDTYLRALIQNITMTPIDSKSADKEEETSAADAGSGSDLEEAAATAKKLNVDTDALKAGGVDPVAIVKVLSDKARQQRAHGAEGAWKAMGNKCPVDPHLADMPPDKLSALVNDRNRTVLREAACANSWLKTMDDLKAAGYGEGKKIGSWTLPEKLRAPVCVGGKDGAYGPINEQTSLIGTLLTDGVTTEGNMNIL
jgi:hypothetical protein